MENNQKAKALLCALVLSLTSGCAMRKNLDKVSYSNLLRYEALSGMNASIDSYEEQTGNHLNEKSKKLEDCLSIYKFLTTKGYGNGEYIFNEEELEEYSKYNDASLQDVSDLFVLSVYSDGYENRREKERALEYIYNNTVEYILKNGLIIISELIERDVKFKVADAQDSMRQTDFEGPYIKYDNVDNLVDVNLISENLGEENVIVRESDPDLSNMYSAHNDNNVMYDLLNLKEKIDELIKEKGSLSLKYIIKIIRTAFNYLKILYCTNFEIDLHNDILPIEDEKQIKSYLVETYGDKPTK